MSADPKARPVLVCDLLAALTQEYLSSPVYAGEQGTDNERFPVLGVTSLGQEPGVVIEISGDPYAERQEQESRIEELESSLRVIRDLVSDFSEEHLSDDGPGSLSLSVLKDLRNAAETLSGKIEETIEGAEV